MNTRHSLLPTADTFPEVDVHLCPALADYPECPIDPRACSETCQLQPDTDTTS